MRSVLISIVAFLALALGLHAQDAPATTTDPQADKIMKRVKLKLSGLNDLKATFVYTLENRAVKSNPISRNGDIKFKRNKYRVDFTDQSLICDGKTIWHYLKTEKEVNVSNYDPQEGFSFDRMFSVYNQDVNARFDRSEVLAGQNVSKLTLFPKKATTDFFKIEMWIATTTEMPTKMVVWGRNGSVTTYELRNLKLNNQFTDTEFVFNPSQYPGVSVIDLR
ncbi:MAG: outer membrane lipoprotein carrier protein LolA [Bacteroidia bacterium]|nr:outer membrane lipoprotein carrier protein LolA [Bacteroidia bacterium]